MYYNACSLLNKIDELRAECPVLQADIIMIVETFCRKDIIDADVSIPGYQIICRRDGRDTAGGRCLVSNPVITKPERTTLSFTIVVYSGLSTVLFSISAISNWSTESS